MNHSFTHKTQAEKIELASSNDSINTTLEQLEGTPQVSSGGKCLSAGFHPVSMAANCCPGQNAALESSKKIKIK